MLTLKLVLIIALGLFARLLLLVPYIVKLFLFVLLDRLLVLDRVG